jgi:hypothetical protein
MRRAFRRKGSVPRDEPEVKMAEDEMMGRKPASSSGGILVLLGLAAVAVSLLIAAQRLSLAMEKLAFPGRPPGSVLKGIRPESQGALAPVGDGCFVFSRGDGVLFLGRLGKERRLELLRVYRLTHDPERHMTRIARRSNHGWYLDDEGEGNLARVRSLESTFLRSARSAEPDLKLRKKAQRAAEELYRLHALPFLIGRLKDDEYMSRRTVALLLGEEGYLAAIPVLIEMLKEPPSEERKRAYLSLVELTEKDFGTDAGAEDQSEAIERWQRWWTRNAPGDRFARKAKR